MRLAWTAVPQSWRDAINELLIVAAGVVLGIAATEVVKAWTDAAEVRAIRAALDQELANDYYAVEVRDRLNPCIARRVRALNDWLDLPPERRPKLPDDIGLPLSIVTFNTVWQVASGNGGAAKIPVDDLLRYAKLYGGLSNFAASRQRELQIWYDIIDFGGRSRIDDREASILRVRLGSAMRAQALFASNREGFAPEFTRLGIRPKPLNSDLSAKRAIAVTSSICRPLYPDAADRPKTDSL